MSVRTVSRDEEDTGHTLADRLRGRIGAAGPITFAEFMEAALYDPEEGFYARPTVGVRGDFVTSPHVSGAFGVLVARQIEELWELLGKPGRFSIVEVGAGDGTLAGQILEVLPPAVRTATDYLAVERSEPGREAMGNLDVKVHSDLREVPTALTGCVFANELLDNLPFHRLRGTDSRPVEMHVGLDGGRFTLVEGPVSSEEVLQLAPPLAPGEEAVVHPGAVAFLDSACAVLERGYVWLIDYGFSGGERPTAPHGYRGHRLEADVLDEPGSRDITAGVDFDVLARHAVEAGHAVWGPLTQRDALIRLGYRRLDEEARTRQQEAAAAGRGIDATRIYSARSRATLLVDPQALGGLLVLCVGVGIDLPPSSARTVG